MCLVEGKAVGEEELSGIETPLTRLELRDWQRLLTLMVKAAVAINRQPKRVHLRMAKLDGGWVIAKSFGRDPSVPRGSVELELDAQTTTVEDHPDFEKHGKDMAL